MGERWISKSLFLTSLRCPKLAWTSIHESQKLTTSASNQHHIEEGRKVGELARKLFPDGTLIQSDSPAQAEMKTRQALFKKQPIFEACLRHNDTYTYADILIPRRQFWDILEVKSGTSVTEDHHIDVAFQKHVYHGAGIHTGRCYLMHINNEYQGQGNLDLERLFVKSDISKEVNKLLPKLPIWIESCKDLFSKHSALEVPIGPQCLAPDICPLQSECWQFLPQRDHVLTLHRNKKIGWEWVPKGIHRIVDIPSQIKLNKKQKIQKQVIESGMPHIDHALLKKWLDKLQYPFYFLDFETIASAVPMFDAVKPYEQIPFQYSLHVIEAKDAPPKHTGYLADSPNDPRPELLKKLQDELGTEGSIIAYNMSFEKGCLQRASDAYTDYQSWWKGIEPRFVDLMKPFQDFAYYHPDQQGRVSIKKVLPALSDMSYNGMEIADGGTAQSEFMRVTYGDASDKDRAAVRKALEEYCKLDTWAMVEILEKLQIPIALSH